MSVAVTVGSDGSSAGTTPAFVHQGSSFTGSSTGNSGGSGGSGGSQQQQQQQQQPAAARQNSGLDGSAFFDGSTTPPFPVRR